VSGAVNDGSVRSEFLVISRGQWDPDVPREEIQAAIDEFYAWHERLVGEGTTTMGSRLQQTGRTVTRDGIVSDGPYGETKEVIGGFWTIYAPDLEAAARIAADNPCLRCGIFLEIRPLEPERASAFVPMIEMLERDRAGR